MTERITELGDLFKKAVDFAVDAHAGQERKGKSAPYVSHPLQVAGLALEYGADEVQAAAALLHDVIEDTDHTRADLEREFGAHVAQIVHECSDAEGPEEKEDWRPRKERYLGHLREVHADTALVSCADKLHNARSILADLRTHGNVVWTHFKGKRDGTPWYYRELVSVFRGLEVHPELFAELERTVEAIEAEARPDA